jgi:putative transposase
MPDYSFRRRRPMRLPHYDYTTCGIYFVTICTHGRRPLFDDPVLRLVAEQQWRRLGRRYTHVALDEWVVMADHLHGLIVLDNVDALPAPPDGNHGIQARPGSLGAIVRSYKAAVTRRLCDRNDAVDGMVWQRGYYDRVIRDEQELDATRRYIEANPLRETEGRDNLAALVERLRFCP